MSIKDVKLIKGMNRNEVNELISEWILLEDDIYLDINYKHKWRCKCENIIEGRTWKNIKYNKATDCGCIKHYKMEKRYKYEVEKTGEYEYIRSYRKGDILPNGKIVEGSPYIKIKHKYCGNLYDILAGSFINEKKRCSKCCHKYEKSFAYHIEKELDLKLEDMWDSDKNTVNPYHIYKSSSEKVWIKCQNKDYHGSYKVSCSNFIRGDRCPYCSNRNGKIHPKDSFAQYHIDNTDPNFLEKYWDYEKNTVNPFEIAPNSNINKVWIKCQNEEVNELNGLMKKDYHGSYEVSCNHFTWGNRCSYCSPKAKNSKVHTYDSFGYYHFDKVLNWHPDNEISPFRVAKGGDKKYKFICHECGHIWNPTIGSISNGGWCSICASSEGEKRIKAWLNYNNINYVHDKPYFNNLVGVGGGLLRPDFILPDYRIWIEYDGEFHYRKMYDEDEYKTLKIHDKRKDEYAKKHGWKLIRISYWEFDNIENILEKIKML